MKVFEVRSRSFTIGLRRSVGRPTGVQLARDCATAVAWYMQVGQHQMRQPQSVGTGKADLPEEDTNASDRAAFIFYAFIGGYQATNEVDGEMEVVYCLCRMIC